MTAKLFAVYENGRPITSTIDKERTTKSRFAPGDTGLRGGEHAPSPTREDDLLCQTKWPRRLMRRGHFSLCRWGLLG